ncbi:MAG: hypothetical protein OXU36_15505 [Candidatus Poribacteria bacterium]|nr:hypothetical protein [Candidatus Poribacteria bacterium]
MNANQNQRYEARMGFTGYECLMAFPVWHSINGIHAVWHEPGFAKQIFQ